MNILGNCVIAIWWTLSTLSYPNGYMLVKFFPCCLVWLATHVVALGKTIIDYLAYNLDLIIWGRN